MGTEQYASHDWSHVTLSLMLLGMVVVVFCAMGLFLYMVNRAGQATGRPQPSAAEQVPEVNLVESAPLEPTQLAAQSPAQSSAA